MRRIAAIIAIVGMFIHAGLTARHVWAAFDGNGLGDNTTIGSGIVCAPSLAFQTTLPANTPTGQNSHRSHCPLCADRDQIATVLPSATEHSFPIERRIGFLEPAFDAPQSRPTNVRPPTRGPPLSV